VRDLPLAAASPEALRTQDCQLALVDLNYVEDTTSARRACG